MAPRVKFENGFKIFLNSEDLERWKETLENAFTLYVYFFDLFSYYYCIIVIVSYFIQYLLIIFAIDT